ncbi:hypothetical protein C0991_007588 [Blastosporella zonata]|nr:hypothetical protein C0991_007588 [Blastosporella zonata]
MPTEGIELSPDGKLLTNDEVIRLATLFVKSGVTKIRLTGGEPTVRKGIDELIGRLNELRNFGLKSIAMTTNGIALHRRLPRFIDNGLTHLNMSLDTLDPFKFELITRRRGHDAVLKALDVALNSSLQSVKLNVVVIQGLNDSEIFDFVEMTKSSPLSVRFIEFMPFTGRASMVDIAEKQPTKRTATASGRIYISPIAYELVTSSYPVGEVAEPAINEAKAKARRKGDALTVAQLAAIMGAKKTSDLIPLCHPLSITNVSVTLTPDVCGGEQGGHRHYILCEATVSTEGKTGVEMEALTAVSVGLLTVWDMLKAVAGREMEIGGIRVTRKAGGRSGDFERETA